MQDFFTDTAYLLSVDFVQSSLIACALLGVLSGVMTSLIVLAGRLIGVPSGMMLAPIIILITLPVLILMFSRRTPRAVVQDAVPAPA